MYEEFYGLKKKPFSLLPDPDFLYLGRNHRLALAMLEYGLMNLAGFTVITGEIGAGKTTLIRHLLRKMAGDVTVGLIANTHNTLGELDQWVLSSLGLDYRCPNRVERYHLLANYLRDQHASGRRTVLVVDEGQNLGPPALEELRILSNLNADHYPLLQVILVGQPELRRLLQRPDLEQFAQRVLVDFHLEPLPKTEIPEYIRYRLCQAGGRETLFARDALEVIAEHARGIPRIVNALCETALVYGFAEQKDVITGSILSEVIRDKRAGGIIPLATRGGAQLDLS